MKASTILGFAVLLGLGAMAACSSDEQPAATNTAAANTTSTTTAGPTTTGVGGAASTTATTTTAAATTAATGGTSAVTTRPCDSLAEQSLDSTMAGVPGSIATYSYGDTVTTRCLEATMPNNICLYGVGADSDDGAGNEYANWGGGIGIQLADANDDGSINAPWDAAALGIDGVQFTLTGVTATAPIRFGIVLVSTDLIPYQDQGFVWGDDSTNDFTMDGTYTVPFAEMFLPSWTAYLTDEDAVADATLLNFDPTNIHSIQFQVVTAPGETRPYDFCVSNITWLSGATPVNVPIPTGDGSGGATSTGSTMGGMGGTTGMGGMGGTTGMGGMGGTTGMGGMGGATTTDSATTTDAAGGTMAAGGSGA